MQQWGPKSLLPPRVRAKTESSVPAHKIPNKWQFDFTSCEVHGCKYITTYHQISMSEFKKL